MKLNTSLIDNVLHRRHQECYSYGTPFVPYSSVGFNTVRNRSMMMAEGNRSAARSNLRQRENESIQRTSRQITNARIIHRTNVLKHA
jgi:hypothetical protein